MGLSSAPTHNRLHAARAAAVLRLHAETLLYQQSIVDSSSQGCQIGPYQAERLLTRMPWRAYSPPTAQSIVLPKRGGQSR
jgi:hypothetical protein